MLAIPHGKSLRDGPLMIVGGGSARAEIFRLFISFFFRRMFTIEKKFSRGVACGNFFFSKVWLAEFFFFFFFFCRNLPSTINGLPFIN